MSTLVESFCRNFRSIVDHPRFDRLRHRRARRRLVSAYVVLAVSVPAVSWWTASDATALSMLVPLMAIGMLIGASVRGISDLPRSALDELQLAMRNRAYTHAYWLCAFIGVAGGVLIRDIWIRDQVMGYAVFITVIMLVSALPALMLAWAMPDEDLDDD